MDATQKITEYMASVLADMKDNAAGCPSIEQMSDIGEFAIPLGRIESRIEGGRVIITSVIPGPLPEWGCPRKPRK